MIKSKEEMNQVKKSMKLQAELIWKLSQLRKLYETKEMSTQPVLDLENEI